MKATLRIEVREGRVVDLVAEAPLCAKFSPRSSSAPDTLWIIGGAAGLLEGDDLTVDVALGRDQKLVVRSIASQVAHPSPNRVPATFTVHASIGTGASLAWAPEPVILSAESMYRAVARVAVAEGGTLDWREELVFGRSGETIDEIDIETRLLIDHGCQPALRDGLRSTPGWRSAAVIGRARYVGTGVRIGGTVRGGNGWTPLACQGELTRVLHEDPLEGRCQLRNRCPD
ncbi:MAG: urease accessory protein UreD [Acidimicrobiia bacterium]